MAFVQFIILLGLLFVTYQDFRFRGIYWFCFPILALLLGTVKLVEAGFYAFWTEALLTGAFAGFQIVCLWIYFLIKKGKLINLTNRHLGWGDILFLFVLCFYLPPISYVSFYIGSLITAILFSSIIGILGHGKGSTIPLAGLQAILLMILLTGKWFAELKFMY